ncbi:hypothetical protein D3C87_1830650 [compost metagenome]
MHDVIDAAHCHGQPVRIPNIADEVAHAGSVELLLHFELLELVARVNDQATGLITLQYGLDKELAERACATGDQDRFLIEHSEHLIKNIDESYTNKSDSRVLQEECDRPRKCWFYRYRLLRRET